MRVRSIQTSLLYQIFLLVILSILGMAHFVSLTSQFLLLGFSAFFLLVDYLLVEVVQVRTRVVQLIVWTVRLTQVESLSLLLPIGLPLLVQYLLAITIVHLLLYNLSGLLLQYENTRLLRENLVIGWLSSLACLVPSWLPLIFGLSLLFATVRFAFSVYQSVTSRQYLYSKSWGYWIFLMILLLNIFLLMSMFVILPESFLFTGLWQLVTVGLVLTMVAIVFFGNQSLAQNLSTILLLILSALLSFILFPFVLDVELDLSMGLVFLFYQLHYILYLASVYWTLQHRKQTTSYAGLSAIVREEKLKEEFANFLHDDLLQDLNALLQLSRLHHTPETQRMIENNLVRLNNFTRERMNDYSPQLLKGVSLYDNYHLLIQSIGQRYPKQELTVRFQAEKSLSLSPPYDVLVFRWLRECVTNCYKSAQASNLEIRLRQDGAVCVLTISDDGCFTKGMELSGGHGLATVSEQVVAVGGQLTYTQGQPTGLIITIVFEMEGDRAIESFISG